MAKPPQPSAQQRSKFKINSRSFRQKLQRLVCPLASPPHATRSITPNDFWKRSSFIASRTPQCRWAICSRTALTTGDSLLMSLITWIIRCTCRHAWCKSTEHSARFLWVSIDLKSSQVWLKRFSIAVVRARQLCHPRELEEPASARHIN